MIFRALTIFFAILALVMLTATVLGAEGPYFFSIDLSHPGWPFSLTAIAVVLTGLSSGLEARDKSTHDLVSAWILAPIIFAISGVVLFIVGLLMLGQAPWNEEEKLTRGVVGVLDMHEVYTGLGLSLIMGGIVGVVTVFWKDYE